MTGRSRSRRTITRRGASLAELLVVLGILAVLAAIAAPRYAASGQRRRFESAVVRLQADVAHAREAARAASASRTLRFSTLENSYWMLGSNALTPNRPGKVRLGEAPYHATIVHADFGGAADLIFDGYGRIVEGGEVRVRIGDLQGRVIFSDGAMRTGDNTDADADTGATVEVDSGGVLSPILGLLGL